MSGDRSPTGEPAVRVRLALASRNPFRRTALETALGQVGVRIALSGPLEGAFLERLALSDAQVVLIDLDDGDPGDALPELLEASELPIVFNDVSGLSLNRTPRQERWFAALVEKVTALAGQAQTPLHCSLGASAPAAADRALARRVWVLGASLGGPQALKRFLGTLADDIPAAFVLVQHLGTNFVARLADQLDRVTGLRVRVAGEGHVLRHGDVLVAPVDRRILVNGIGGVDLPPLPADAGPYRPSVDVVAADIAARYGAASGLILFSGMGDDGRRGALRMAAAGGAVWAQDAASCVISSMPDHARRSGVVSRSGSPEVLARELMRYLHHDTE